MKRWQIIFVAILVAILSGLSGYYFQQLTKDDAVSNEQFNTKKLPSPEEVIGTDVAEFSLLDLNGERRYLSEWKGKLIAINFWATWCAPCREEIPAFVELQEKYATQGLQFIGIALQQADEVRDFIEEYNVNYPSLVGGDEVIKVASQLGNNIGAMPYTVIINSEGKITFTRRGPLSKQGTFVYKTHVCFSSHAPRGICKVSQNVCSSEGLHV